MKAEKINNAEMIDKAKASDDRSPGRETAPPNVPVKMDTVTVGQDALDQMAGDYPIQTEAFATKRLKKKKPLPDPRYTAQAILDREILGLKKFYS